MIAWMTRMSIFDTADDMDIDRAAVAAQQTADLSTAMIYGETPENWPDDWESHPVVRCWRDYEVALAAYAGAMNLRLVKLGVSTTSDTMRMAETIRELRHQVNAPFVAPPWFSDTDVLLSHRSNMARRWPDAYDNFWKGVPARMPYIWPFVEDGRYSLMLSKYDKALLASGERVLPKKILDRIENL